jgi:hypothetical protein
LPLFVAVPGREAGSFLASCGEDLVGIRVLLLQLLALGLHSDGDLLPANFDIFEFCTASLDSRLTAKRPSSDTRQICAG